MSEFFGNIEKIMSLIDQAVKIAEKSTASGETKRKTAITMVLQLAKFFGLDLTQYEDLIGHIIDVVVFGYNLLGVFTHSGKTATK